LSSQLTSSFASDLSSSFSALTGYIQWALSLSVTNTSPFIFPLSKALDCTLRRHNLGIFKMATPPDIFCDGFFEVDFELWAFWSLPPEYLGL
jgi:hypothetical protein